MLVSGECCNSFVSTDGLFFLQSWQLMELQLLLLTTQTTLRQPLSDVYSLCLLVSLFVSLLYVYNRYHHKLFYFFLLLLWVCFCEINTILSHFCLQTVSDGSQASLTQQFSVFCICWSNRCLCWWSSENWLKAACCLCEKGSQDACFCFSDRTSRPTNPESLSLNMQDYIPRCSLSLSVTGAPLPLLCSGSQTWSSVEAEVVCWAVTTCLASVRPLPSCSDQDVPTLSQQLG